MSRCPMLCVGLKAMVDRVGEQGPSFYGYMEYQILFSRIGRVYSGINMIRNWGGGATTLFVVQNL